MYIFLIFYIFFYSYYFARPHKLQSFNFNRAEIKSIKAVCLSCVAHGAKKERGAARGVGAGGRQKETGIAMHCFLDSCPKWPRVKLTMGAV